MQGLETTTLGLSTLEFINHGLRQEVQARQIAARQPKVLPQMKNVLVTCLAAFTLTMIRVLHP